MKLSDTVSTATQNLLARKWRTALNLLGVVVACTMLIMTLAGTRGVADGIHRMIATLDGVSRFVVRPNWRKTSEPPTSAYEVTGQMTDARRKRMQSRLKDQWLSVNGTTEPLNQKAVDEIAAIAHVSELVPSFYLDCEFTTGNPDANSQDEQTMRGNAAPVAVKDKSVDRDIVVGQRLMEKDTDGAVIDELFAYRLGYQSDSDLESLIGQTIFMRFENTSLRDEMFYFLRAMGDQGGADFSEKAQLIIAIQKLVGDIDKTALSKQQKEMIETAFGKMLPPSIELSRTNASDDNSVNSDSSDSRFLTRKLVIKGVIREAQREGIEGLLQLARGHTTSAILIHPDMAREIRSTLKRKRVSRAVGMVDHIDNLESVIQKIESRGYRTNSVASTIGQINKHIRRTLIGLSVLAGIILLVSALTISNTLTISVLERTPEFGIMKAMGARDRDVLAMMLCEGAMTGFIGAAISTLTSLALASTIGYFVRGYVEDQLGDVFTAEIFRFRFYDVAIAALVGCVVCTAASVLPALRAARLDPIVAMRRK